MADYKLKNDVEPHILTPEEREKGRHKGHEMRRLKKSLKESLIEVLESKNPKTNMTYQEMITKGLLKGATKGNSSNYRVIAEMLEEIEKDVITTPPLKIEIVKDNADLEKAMYEADEED